MAAKLREALGEIELIATEARNRDRAGLKQHEGVIKFFRTSAGT